MVLLLLAACFGCDQQDDAPPGRIRNVLLISIDTCRADRLGSYGAQGGVTPNLDRLATEGTLFENVTSPAPITLPAHASMLTGTVPPFHGVRDNLAYRLGESNVTLAERLKAGGFVTGAVVGAFVLDSRFGLDQGFDSYDDRISDGLAGTTTSGRRGEDVSRSAIAWLEEHQRDPFFLFLHYFDPHLTYDPPEPFRSRFADDLYSGEIAYTDHSIGQVMEALRDMNLEDSTLIIVTSDHGEMLGEHEEATHSYFIYRSAARVPLIFRLPGGVPGQRISERVGLIDVAPTVAGLLNLPPMDDVQGVDLSAALTTGTGPDPERPLYLESVVPITYGCNPLLGLVRGRWKYILTTRPELYDLESDPTESTNLASTRVDERVSMNESLREVLERTEGASSPDSRAAMDDDALHKLRGLGYVGGPVQPAELTVEPGRNDPKDLIEFHRLNMGTYQLIDDGNHADAARMAQRMVDEQPDLSSGHLHLGRLALEANDASSALPHLRRAVDLDPNDAISRFHLGRVYSRLTKPAQAIEQYQRSLELHAENVEAHINLGIALRQEGRLEEAIEHYRRALELDPDDVDALNNLANALAGADRLEEALPYYRHAVELAPDSASVHSNMALALARSGLTNEAITAYQRSLQLALEQPKIHRALATLLMSAGKPGDAAEHYLRALAMEPDSAALHNNLGNALAAQGDFDAAEKHYRTALRFDPAHARAHFNLGMSLRIRSRLGEAAEHFRRVLELDPGHPEARRQLEAID